MAHNDRAYLRAVRESRPQETIAHTPIYCINFVKETQIPAPEASRIPSYSPAQAKPLLFRLTRLGGNLGGRALSTLLALDALGGTLAGGSVLGLLGLLSLLGSGLLLLGVLDGLLASSSTGLRALVAALLDHVEGSTNDSTLGLDGTAGTLLSDFLYALKDIPSAFLILSQRFVTCRYIPAPFRCFRIVLVDMSMFHHRTQLKSRHVGPFRKTKETTSTMGKTWRY